VTLKKKKEVCLVFCTRFSCHDVVAVLNLVRSLFVTIKTATVYLHVTL